MYNEYAPAATSCSSIECIWTYNSGSSDESFKVLPDGCFDLLIDLTQEKVWISGGMTVAQQRSLRANVELIGIRMKVEGFAALLQTPPQQILNERALLSDLTGNTSSPLGLSEDQLLKYAQKLPLLEGYLSQVLFATRSDIDHQVLRLAKMIRAVQGNSQCTQLYKNFILGPQQLQRRFKRSVGFSPKAFASILKFKRAVMSIQNSSDESLLSIALRHGYYDHAHLSHEFHRISGRAPGSFRG